MKRILPTLLCLALLAGVVFADGTNSVPSSSAFSASLARQSIAKLEQRLGQIDGQLNSLAAFNLRNGIGSVCYRSKLYDHEDNREWVCVELGQELEFDQIILVPSIGSNSQQRIHAQCFPVVFEIVVGCGQDDAGTTIASFGREDHLLPRIAPLVIDCPDTRASWVRLEASVLSQLAFDGKYALQLSELLIFSGEKCLSLDPATRTTSPHTTVTRGPFQQRFLVDGFVPYLMESAIGDQSVALVADIAIDNANFTIDLGAIYTLDEIHLHSVELSDNIPQTSPHDFGIPQRFVIQGAKCADFGDAVPLVEYVKESVFDAGPIIMRRIPATACRYLRLVVVEPYMAGSEHLRPGPKLGFAEFAAFSDGSNVALGRPVSANFESKRRLAALTDGRNFYGSILSMRTWLNELALRHVLDRERPLVIAELNQRYARQRSQLTIMTWLAALLVVAIAFTILVERLLRLRQAAAIRERLAADLHDELGGNLHAIGLLGDHAQASVGSPEKMTQILKRLRDLTERTSDSARQCSRALLTPDFYGDLAEEMHRTSSRIMADLEHEIVFEGAEHLRRLKPRAQADLLFFYKECLVNISRHSEATQFRTLLIADQSQIRLTISDNGRGISDEENVVPPSLARRAKLLGAKLSVESQVNGGTCVELTLKVGRLRSRS